MDISSVIRWFCVLLIAANTTLACSSDTARNSAQETTLEEILQRNLEAVRVQPADRNIENVDLILRINEADFSLVARYRASTQGFMRIDVFDGSNRLFSEGIDEMGVWEWPSDKDAPQNVSHDGVRALEHGIEFNLFPLAELPDRGHGIELDGFKLTAYFSQAVLETWIWMWGKLSQRRWF